MIRSETMAVNREAPLLRRDPLEGPYLLLTFRHPEVANESEAGQFVMIKAGTSSEPPLRRPFSIMDVDPHEDSFTLFLKDIGPGSHALAALHPGEAAQCLGPLGRPFTEPPPAVEALFVAGGYGIAPFVLFGRKLRDRGRRATVFYGGRTSADLQLRAPFESMELPLRLASEDGSVGTQGRVTAAVEAYIETIDHAARLYACGPDAMLHAVARLADERAIDAEVSLDPWMGCGVGTCLGCVVWIQEATQPRPKYRCACTDGPIFDAKTVVWPVR